MPNRIKACVFRVGGTNCDVETKRSLDEFEGVESEVVRINQMDNNSLQDYDFLVLPGGFSYGDHIRAGSVFANKIKNTMRDELKNFIDRGGHILGICNGFQILVEAGLLPGLDGISEFPTAALAINESSKYECRWVHIKNENRENCVFTKNIEKNKELFMPVAHAEGRFMIDKENENEILEKLHKNDQVVFKYCDSEGNLAGGKYPENPNGSLEDIAGICDPSGRIFGLMPHPERAFYGLQLPNWTQNRKTSKYADGRLIFESVINNLKE